MTISDIPHSPEKAIIINCGTHLSASLSILSVLRYCQTDLVVINCPMPSDTAGAEQAYFVRLQAYCEEHNLGTFTRVEQPLRLHGDTLDFVFRNIQADRLLLVDSDLEVLEPTLIGQMRRWIEQEHCFGAGFFHGPYFGFGSGKFPEGFYAERMWIPFTLLKVKYIRQALAAGQSFNIRKIYNDFPYNNKIGGLLYKYAARFHIPLSWNPLRRRYLGFRANYVLQDTGANIYEYLRNKGLFYGGGRTDIYPFYVAHYDGITRSWIAQNKGSVDTTATQYTSVQELIVSRLRSEYNIPSDLLQ